MDQKTNVATIKPQSLPALAMSEDELVAVLTTSLYPGAAIPSIKMVLSYCRAAGLDPMQKPCHIVPMWDSKTKAMRDVVMPGIGLYRTQAARSGAYAGVTEPEFGADVTETFPEESGYEGKRRPAVTVSFPVSCKVVVKRRMPDGQIAEFAATERWKENYATAGKDSRQPNAMWLRRPYAQLAKCSEAQALRKAFPEFGAAPTADEMEGKSFDEGATVIDGEITHKRTTPQSAAAANVADGYDEYEDDMLPILQHSAEQGSKALEAAFKALPKSAHKAALWTRHGAALKDSAATADFVTAPEPEEVTE